jgi:maltooligosyltrehalose trehalohydrolase
MKVGALYNGDGECEFIVWAPLLKKVSLKIVSPEERVIPMERSASGYWRVSVKHLYPSALYFYGLGESLKKPDPASFFQPRGVNGPSEVINHRDFLWEDSEWKGLIPEEMVIYELHVGTFTPEGTFEAVIERLPELRDTGVTVLEIMPVAQFSGERNWGYDGVFPFSTHNYYGRPEAFKKLINAAHKNGFAVILDVVYNHIGIEGNCLGGFGPYFTAKYKMPWGPSVNFDDAYSDDVRNFFIENALYWLSEYHIDALRLDAVHGICDMSAVKFLEELAERVDDFSKEKNRKVYLIAESDLNDARIVRPKKAGGYGLDMVWCDDFHHALHGLLTGESAGYYADFGSVARLEKSFKEAMVFTGQYSVFRKRRHGTPHRDIASEQFVVFSQNHDQVGNRAAGERLSSLTGFEGIKLAAGTVLFSPYIPLLFMGEEYGEETPFLYFVDYSDERLADGVRAGRKKEFQSFMKGPEIDDPQSRETFVKSKLRWEDRSTGKHKLMLDFYKELIKLRKTIPAFKCRDRESINVRGMDEQRMVFVNRRYTKSEIFCIMNFNRDDVSGCFPFPAGSWEKVIDSADIRWMGPGASMPDRGFESRDFIMRGFSFALFQREVPPL